MAASPPMPGISRSMSTTSGPNGRATVEVFAREGAAVVVNDVDPDPANEAAQAIKEAGGQAMVSTDNTVNLDEARRMMEAAANEFGRVDIVENNAGITRDRMFHK